MSHKQAKRLRQQNRQAFEVTKVSGLTDEQLKNIREVYLSMADDRKIVPNEPYQPIAVHLESTTPNGFLVENWRKGWYWFSNLAFTAIVAVNAAPIPPEIIHALPANIQTHVTIGLAIVGVLGRMVNQSKGKKAEVINDDPA